MRSIIVMGTVALAIWALVFIIGFVRGMINGYVEKAIRFETAHFQIHNPDFLDDHELKYAIEKSSAVLTQLHEDPNIRATSHRLIANAMISTANGTRGLMIKGVNANDENTLTRIAETMEEGAFLDGKNKHQIVISRTVAEKLKSKLRKKIVVTFQNADGDLTYAAFRVAGIYNTENLKVDGFTAFVSNNELQTLSALPIDAAHEIAVLTHDLGAMPSSIEQLKRAFPDLSVQGYEELAPELAMFKTQVQLNMIVMTAIIMLALIFGIINTMLMAVLERTRELGMLMAIGMNKVRVFSMIVIETIYLAVFGAPFGMLLGFLTVEYFNKNGIDLSMWSKGLAQFGMRTFVRPELDAAAYLFVAAAIFTTALLASIYPSLKAIRLKPVVALRKV